MDDPAGLLCHPEGEIVILSPVERRAESANPMSRLRSHHKQMAEIHLAPQSLHRERGLEERLRSAAVLGVELVLIAVGQIDVVESAEFGHQGADGGRR